MSLNYHDLNYTEPRGLDTQALVRLEKHQRMIHDTLEWQRLSRLAEPAQKPPLDKWLILALAAVVNLLTRHRNGNCDSVLTANSNQTTDAGS